VAATNDVDLNQVSAFVWVMKAGSFTAAARALGLPKSSVSRRVSALEETLRVRLLQRGARKLVLTEAGRLYFEQARTALGRLADANAAVIDMTQEVAGPIRFTAGGDNTGLIANLIAAFLGRYPKVQIEAVLTPRRVDLVGEGFDLALRAGPLVDSSLIVRRLGRRDLALFASRGYLRRAGRPRRVGELSGHRFVLCGEPPQRHELRLTGPAGVESLKIDGPLVVHEFGFAADAIAAGIGIGLIPEAYSAFMAKRGLGSAGRELVRLLPDHSIPGTDLSLVSPPTAYEPARVGLLRDFLAERIQPLLRAGAAAAQQKREDSLGRPTS
jgi:DNA-binding transcriptional LysR family regulator